MSSLSVVSGLVRGSPVPKVVFSVMGMPFKAENWFGGRRVVLMSVNRPTALQASSFRPPLNPKLLDPEFFEQLGVDRVAYTARDSYEALYGWAYNPLIHRHTLLIPDESGLFSRDMGLMKFYPKAQTQATAVVFEKGVVSLKIETHEPCLHRFNDKLLQYLQMSARKDRCSAERKSFARQAQPEIETNLLESK